MPKMRTHKSAAKRFKVTARGKVMGRHAGKSHLLTRKREGRKRRLGLPHQVAPGDAARVKRMLPYHRPT